MKLCVSSEIFDRYGARLSDTAPDWEIVRVQPDGQIVGSDGQVVGSLDGVEILFFSLDFALQPKALAQVIPLMETGSLRWIQSPGAGVDHPIFANLLARGVRLTNASGLHAEPIAQYIFTYVLHWERNVARHLAQQRAREWQVIVSEDLTAKTLGIVGLGGIGLAAARIAQSFGMRVLASRRTPADDLPNVDAWFPPERLHELLAQSDYVVMCVPLTDTTRGMIGRNEFDAMRNDAVLINVARGDVVDESALLDALATRQVRGATLDVVAEEPLPATSPLWTLPNCVITPHDAGYSPRANERLVALFLDNVERFRSESPLRNEIHDVGLTET